MRQLPSLFADWANGIFATFAAAYVTGLTEIPWWYFVIALLLSHLPDLDAVPELLRRGKIAASGTYVHDHREGLHYPVLFVLIGVGLIQLVPFWGWLFLVVTTLHFLNDTFGTGWGIKWLWPLSTKNYKFFTRRVNQLKGKLENDGVWNSIDQKERELRVLVSWSKQELPEYIAKWGHSDWIEVYYYRWNVVGVVEYTLFATALLSLWYYYGV